MIRKNLELFNSDNIFEIRVLVKVPEIKSVHCGIFDDIDKAVSEINMFKEKNESAIFYMTVNDVGKQRIADNTIVHASPTRYLRDSDFTRYRWLGIDIDGPDSWNVVSDIVEKFGIDPVSRQTPRGHHLFYKADFTSSYTPLLKRLSDKFSTADSKIDTVVGNISRIWRIDCKALGKPMYYDVITEEKLQRLMK